eukprot:5286332-Pyramimonas_sp.AAC.1
MEKRDDGGGDYRAEKREPRRETRGERDGQRKPGHSTPRGSSTVPSRRAPGRSCNRSQSISSAVLLGAGLGMGKFLAVVFVFVFVVVNVLLVHCLQSSVLPRPHVASAGRARARRGMGVVADQWLERRVSVRHKDGGRVGRSQRRRRGKNGTGVERGRAGKRQHSA